MASPDPSAPPPVAGTYTIQGVTQPIVADAPVVAQEPAVAPPAPAPDPAPAPAILEPDFEKAREGAFVDVVAGEHAGLFGVYLQTVERDENDQPLQVIVRNRDHGGDADLAIVRFDQIRPSARTGGR